MASARFATGETDGTATPTHLSRAPADEEEEAATAAEGEEGTVEEEEEAHMEEAGEEDMHSNEEEEEAGRTGEARDTTTHATRGIPRRSMSRQLPGCLRRD